jgi:hydrogenase expression/formation protein HypD
MALSLAKKDCIVLTYGDMLRVPGSSGSLQELKGQGAWVEIVTSAMRSIDVALAHPEREVVFVGVGFETTAPATAVTLDRARRMGLENLSVLCLHKTVPPVLRALASNPDLKIDGFILPGNVTVVAGMDDYSFLTEELHKAAAAAGFDPEEILAALVDLARQVTTGHFRLSAYRMREVPRKGNPMARKFLSEVFEPCDTRWRGLGVIPGSGYRVGKAYACFDAAQKFDILPSSSSSSSSSPTSNSGCRCGEVLSGVLTPPECELYGTACTPLTPVGPCMVSSEGTCGAWHRFNP